MPAEAPPEFLDLLQPVLTALERDVGVRTERVELQASGIRATLVASTLLVPENYVRHWRRFGILPTALVRDTAYEVKKRALGAATSRSSVEADALAYAERFLRMIFESQDD